MSPRAEVSFKQTLLHIHGNILKLFPIWFLICPALFLSSRLNSRFNFLLNFSISINVKCQITPFPAGLPRHFLTAHSKSIQLLVQKVKNSSTFLPLHMASQRGLNYAIESQMFQNSLLFTAESILKRSSLSSFQETSRIISPLWELLPSNLSWRPIGSRQSKWLANCREACKYELERQYKCGVRDNYVRIFFFTLLNLGYGLNYYSSRLRFAHSRAGLMAAPLQRSGEYDIS